MDFELQHDLPRYELDEEWQVLLATQARMLEAMLARVADTVTTVTTRSHRTQGEMQRLSYLLSQSEQFLTTLAEQNVSVERETAAFQAVGTDVERLHVLGQVTAALHANLTAARRYLFDTRGFCRKVAFSRVGESLSH
jgi:uncharacterized protein YaaN involved in tellurite resistance